jgi:hypothetical protein
MIVVALAGVVLASVVTLRWWADLSRQYEARAFWLEIEADFVRSVAELNPPAIDEERANLAAWIVRVERLAQKYKDAATRPWLPLERDPIEP